MSPPTASELPVFGGWIATEDTTILLVLPDLIDVRHALLSLGRIGIDRINGILACRFEASRGAGKPIGRVPAMTTVVLAEQQDTRVLDVRDDREFEEGHHPHAVHPYVGYIVDHPHRITPPLRKDEKFAVSCSRGSPRRSGDEPAAPDGVRRRPPEPSGRNDRVTASWRSSEQM